MTRYDLTPLFRSTVGFDRVMQLLDAAAGWDDAPAKYPAYDIEKTDEDHYRITLAVPGCRQDELHVELRENTLVVSVSRDEQRTSGTEYLYRGIDQARFEQSFQLADYVTVVGASLENGLLTIELRREVPEELKPRKIEISTGGSKSIVGKARKLVESAKRVA